MTIVADHPTSRKILDAFAILDARGGRVTDPMLSELSGISKRTVKKRRLAMIKQGGWPGKRRAGRFSTEVITRLKALGAVRPRPTYVRIARILELEFGRSIHPKTVERILTRPSSDSTEAIRKAVRDEALAEYRGRHASRPVIGTPVWKILATIRRLGGDLESQHPPEPTILPTGLDERQTGRLTQFANVGA